jgi:DHA2 family multidrug resistance protein
MVNGFIAAGADTVTATGQALMAMRGLLLREASMVSFVMLFRLLGVVFLLMIPLVFIMRRPKGRAAPVDVH